MSYFNEYDRRLDRMCAIAVMIMESFTGLEHQYSYTISGHSGESPDVDLVREGMPPRSKSERLEVIQAMYEHASFCRSGDNTLASAVKAVEHVRAAPADDYMVFLLSDAMLAQYRVTPANLADALLSDPMVNAYAIFVAEEETANQVRIDIVNFASYRFHLGCLASLPVSCVAVTDGAAHALWPWTFLRRHSEFATNYATDFRKLSCSG
jgi:hypothetical protein